MIDIDPETIKLFTIPLSYFTVVISLLLIQWGMVNIISDSLARVSFSHRRLSAIMNWWGVFIHELSHAVTAIATLNKVTEFKVTSKGGYVVHENNRSGFIQWLAVQLISVSPAFVPPLITALVLRYLGYLSFQDIVFNAGEPVSIISSLYLDLIPYIVRTVGWLFVSLDYTKAGNILLLLVLTFSFSFAYPSSVKRKKSTQGDMQSFFELLVKFPVYTILFILLCFISFWILFKFDAALFLNVLTFLILLPVLSMFGLVLTFLFIMLIDLFDNSSRIHIIIALSASVLVYAAATQLALKQYMINIISISVLAGALMLLKKQ